MILIDFEELMEMYNNKYQEFNVYDLRFLKEEYLPVVEAIPVKWLLEQSRKLPITSEKGMYIDEIIEDWKKENE